MLISNLHSYVSSYNIPLTPPQTINSYINKLLKTAMMSKKHKVRPHTNDLHVISLG